MNSSETYLKEIKKAATGGNADAQLFLAKLYSEGFPQDFDEAAKWAHLHSSETYLKLKNPISPEGLADVCEPPHYVEPEAATSALDGLTTPLEAPLPRWIMEVNPAPISLTPLEAHKFRGAIDGS